ncbi:hypothetical protein NDU88_004015 [Pleurodeles waltl]|uniref:Uncharacterized protein n=1 Tax=Pleurodeles waltl TaxID=8319 RepID=A0AAV7LKH0_PLEWA|nr:hypothetical protein NDU88_004015 [Pleurodeles waltl]
MSAALRPTGVTGLSTQRGLAADRGGPGIGLYRGPGLRCCGAVYDCGEPSRGLGWSRSGPRANATGDNCRIARVTDEASPAGALHLSKSKVRHDRFGALRPEGDTLGTDVRGLPN